MVIMKFLITTALFIASIFITLAYFGNVQIANGNGLGTINQLSQWATNNGYITQNAVGTILKLTGYESSGDCLVTDSNGVVSTSTCGTGGSGSNFDIIPNGLETATTTDFVRAAYFVASSTTGTSTFAGALTMNNWALSTSTVVCMYPDKCQFQATASTTNSVAKIVEAIEYIDSIGGGFVHVKAGRYICGDATVVPPNSALYEIDNITNVHIFGDGIATHIDCTGNKIPNPGNDPIQIFRLNDFVNSSISNIYFQGDQNDDPLSNGLDKTPIMMAIIRGQNVSIENISVLDGFAFLQLRSTANVNVNNIDIRNNEEGITLSGSTTKNINISNIRHYKYARDGRDGYLQTSMKFLDGTHNVNVSNFVSQDNFRDQFRIEENSHNLNFSNTSVVSTENSFTEGAVNIKGGYAISASNISGIGIASFISIDPKPGYTVQDIAINNFNATGTTRGVTFGFLGGNSQNIHLTNGSIRLLSTTTIPTGIVVRNSLHKQVNINNVSVSYDTGAPSGKAFLALDDIQGFSLTSNVFGGPDGDFDMQSYTFTGSMTDNLFTDGDIRSFPFSDTNYYKFVNFIGNRVGNANPLLYTNQLGTTTFSGTVGIGTTTLSSLFSITGTLGSTQKLITVASSTSAELFNVTSNGIVGIGVNNPLTQTGNLAQIGSSSVGNKYLVFQTSNNDETGIQYYLADGTTLRGYAKWDTNEDFLLKGDTIRFDVASKANAMVLLETSGNVGIGTTTPSSKLDVWGTSSGTILTLFSNAGTKFMEMLNTGVTTLLGTWDFSGATVKQHTYKSFTYPSTATTTVATTTLPLGTAFTAEAWNTAECWVTNSTGAVVFSDGTNKTNSFTATTTPARTTLSVNNTFTASERRYAEIGILTNAQLSCTVDVTVNN